MPMPEFSYENSMSQAERVDAIADNMENIAERQLQVTLETVREKWTGKEARDFAEYCASTQSDIRDQVKQLRALAKRIRDAAKVVRDAEEQAKAVIRKNTEESNPRRRGR